MDTVSWQQCQEFLTELNSRLEGLELSLPSEAQWEYACRAGTETARYSENLDAIAWYGENSGNETHFVAGKEANSWGLYDMLGNVYEWCADVWVKGYTEKARAAVAESASAHRVFRGGSWSDVARDVRAAYRGHMVPTIPALRPGLPLCRVQGVIESGVSAGERGGGCGATRSARPGERSGASAKEGRLRCPGQMTRPQGQCNIPGHATGVLRNHAPDVGRSLCHPRTSLRRGGLRADRPPGGSES